MDPDPVILRLTTTEQITQGKKEQLEAEKVRSKRVDLLMNEAIRKHNRFLEIMIQALIASGQGKVANVLKCG